MNPLSAAIDAGTALFFYRGRVALYAILKALDIKPGDEVLIQAFTCLAVPNPIVSMGAMPVYIDIHPCSFNMDPAKFEASITPKSKVVVVQHTFGIPADMGSILDIARRRRLFVVEDCAHTISSCYQGQMVGTFGDAAFYSFEWGKPVIAGLGGAAVVNNPSLLPRMKTIYQEMIRPPAHEGWIIEFQYLVHALLLNPTLYWSIRDAYRLFSRLGLVVGSFREQELAGQTSPDYRKQMFNIHRRRLIRKLQHLDQDTAHRNWVAQQYHTHLPGAFLGKTSEAVLMRYPLLVDDKRAVLEAARAQRVEMSDIFRTPIHPLTAEQWHCVGYHKGSCPVAEETSGRIVSLPTHSKIGWNNIDRAVSLLQGVRSDRYLKGPS